MVEQVRVNPEEVRGYGNICEGHTLEDFIVSNSGLAKEKETVHGALTDVYKLVYSLYGLIFSFDKGNKQLYLHSDNDVVVGFSFSEKSLVFNTVSHISFAFADKELVVDDEYYLFIDKGTTTSHNDNWSGLSYMTRDDTGTTISNTGTGTLFETVRMNNSNLGFANTSYVVEFEIVENPSSTNRFRFDGQTICDGESHPQQDISFSQNETGKFRFVYNKANNTILKYKDGEYVSTYNHHFCGNMGFLFRLESGASIKYKDFIIYKTGGD